MVNILKSDLIVRDIYEKFESGKLEEAAHLAKQELRKNPNNPLLNYILGTFLIKKGDFSSGILSLEKTNKLVPNKPNIKITLANAYLNNNNYKECITLLEEVKIIEPNLLSLYYTYGNMYKKKGQLDIALKYYSKALAMHRSSEYWSREYLSKNIVKDPSYEHTFLYASQSKIEHDIEQINYLIKNLNINFNKEKEALINVLKKWPKNIDINKALKFDNTNYNLINKFYNKVIYLTNYKSFLGKVLNSHNLIIQDKHTLKEPLVMVIDNFLTKESINEIFKFCVESTIWFDCKESGGYLGAYMGEGFNHPILIQLAENLVYKFPSIFKNYKLTQMWAFKYGKYNKGTRMHADKAKINVNFWITPDDSCKLKNLSGITIYNLKTPNDYSFFEYNQTDDLLIELIKEKKPKKIDINYKYNRCVIFDSKLIHQTQDYEFKSGYENRRINITMLFN